MALALVTPAQHHHTILGDAIPLDQSLSLSDSNTFSRRVSFSHILTLSHPSSKPPSTKISNLQFSKFFVAATFVVVVAVIVIFVVVVVVAVVVVVVVIVAFVDLLTFGFG